MMTSAGYATHIISVMHDYLHAYPELVFMQDNSSPHTGLEAQREFGARGLMPIYWPPSCPDLNPIENIWHLIKQCIKSRRPCPRHIAELRQAVREEWEAITLDEICYFVDTMPDRIYAVLQSHGAHTMY